MTGRAFQGRKHRRTFSIDFKKEVVAEHVGGATLHRLARRHRIASHDRQRSRWADFLFHS
jgi:transposase-like protein